MKHSNEGNGRTEPTNVKPYVKEGVLYLAVDLKHQGELSSTGKAFLVASTHGFMPIEGHEGVAVSLNVTRRIPREQRKAIREAVEQVTRRDNVALFPPKTE